MDSIRKFSKLPPVLLPTLLLAPCVAATPLETTEVVGQRGEALSASEGYISADSIALRPLLRSGEILELVPGMVVTQHSGTGKANQYFLRGFNLDHGTDFATSVNGMPLNMRTHGHGQGYTDLNPVIPEALSGVSYRKGAHYAEVGDFSGAGSAMLTTRRSFDGHTLSLTSGEDDYQRLLVMGGVQSAGDWFYALEHATYDGPWRDIDEDQRRSNALLTYTGALTDGSWSVSLMAYDNQWNSADQIPQRAVTQLRTDELGSIDTTLGGESSRYSLSGHWTQKGLKVSLYAARYELQLWSNFTYFLDEPVNGDQFEQVDQRWLYGGEIAQTWELEGFIRPLNLRTGLQWRYDDIDEVGLYHTRARQRLGVTRADRVKESSSGVFTELEILLSSALRATLGARFDYYDFEVSNRAGTNRQGVNLDANSGEANDSKTSLKASIAYTLTDHWEAYAAIGDGFHSNDARGTTIAVDPADGSQVQTVDPLVASLGYEIGVLGTLAERADLSLAVWALELDSELLFVGDAGATEASEGSKRWGAEATLHIQLSDFWLADLEYAWTDATFTRATGGGREIPGAIEEVAQAGLSFRQPQGWFGSLRARYFGERPLVEDGSVSSDDSLVFNALFGRSFGNWSLELEVLNLLDSDDHDIDYFYPSQLAGEASAVEDIHFHPLEPRTARLTVNLAL